MAFTLEFTPRARDHLRALRKRDQQMIVDAIASHLAHQPDQPTQRRKKLAENLIAPWELRVGDYRVFYKVDYDNNCVIIAAVGLKSRNILRIGGEEVEL